jgi:hypothetical protein
MLPLTVSRAAIELDRASQGQVVELNATRKFAEFLHDAISDRSNSAGLELEYAETKWLDANTADIVGSALAEIEGPQKNKTIQDVIESTIKIVTRMESANPTETRMDLEILHRFCIAFGKNLISIQEASRNEYSSNPFVS